MRLLLLLLIFASFPQFVDAQVYTYHQATKEHYSILNADQSGLKDRVFQAAFDYRKFDELRFLNERREIKLQDTDVTLVLFSAKELLERYGKQISPFTIMPGQDFKDVELKFADTKHPEFIVVIIE